MGGFLPLVEGFLAYALTILALCFAVSSILSVVQRSGRWRSRELRKMMEYLFRNDLLALYAELSGAKPEKDADWDKLRDELGGLDKFLVDMTMLPVPRDAQARPSEAQAAVDPRVALLRESSKFRAAASMADALSESEFRTRLLGSDAGAKIAAKAAGKPTDFNAAADKLTACFNAHGRAATERFQRLSMRWSVALAFVLAFAANVDSLNLLNRYLSDPKLAAQIVAENKELAEKGGLPTPADAGAKAAALDRNLTKVAEAIDKLDEAAKDRFKAISAGLKEVKAVAESVQATVNASASALAALNNGFPIGWTLYPACTEMSASARCAQLARLKDFPSAAQNQSGGFDLLKARVSWMWENDLAGLGQWLIGVLLTGAMVGLGAPFWVEVVNNLLRAKNLIADFRPKN